MKIKILHEIRGRIRVHLNYDKMSFREADILEYYLTSQENVLSAKVYERTSDVAVSYQGDREEVLRLFKGFSFETAKVPEEALQYSGREVNREYWDRLVNQVVIRYGCKWFLPYTLRTAITLCKSAKYIWSGLKSLAKGKIEVSVLDATAIGVSIFMGDTETAASVMFLLGVGETLEDWTHKKSVDDLARSMSLNIHKVWLMAEGKEVLVDVKDIHLGDHIVVHMGNMIPFDGVVVEGEGSVNQASLTGESLPVVKKEESFVYAGTVLEEGELIVEVKETTGSNKFDKIVTMIEESEKLKSTMEGQAEHLADRLVPYTLLGTALVYLLTRNVTKAMAVLMVDFSCALKLAMPISVLSAIREAGGYQITVKGGRFLEQVAQADTIVFDKTGTLTKAQPTVKQVVSFCGEEEDEMLRIAACLEEHFPHSMAKAVVQAAKDKSLIHEEMHSKVEYIMAHGISSMIDGRKVVIGSYHFVFEDESCSIPAGKEALFDQLPEQYSHLFMAMDHKLAAVICIEDPLREEAEEIITQLRENGITKIVMMTGDSKRAARAIGEKLGLDECYWEVLPEDKAAFVEKEKAAGRKVIMIGDGINDSPALSAADVGIAISDGAQIAREIADITVEADSLANLVVLRKISTGLMKRIDSNYRKIVGINSALIVLGVASIIQPTTSALFHNTSTLLITLDSMKDIVT
ncbi:MAG: heavy metal translocating P-type ATPase [Lachnospiraceae bacterium]|nr:heavy metal translocating P-type ATPase [Lachnospiraceae bacterium]